MFRNLIIGISDFFRKPTQSPPARTNVLIQEHQKIYGSWGVILGECLKSNSISHGDCDGIYKEFKKQQDLLKEQEDKYFDPMVKARDQNLGKFDTVFVRSLMPMHLPVEFQKLKTETMLQTEELLESKREFESFKRAKLKEIVDPVSEKLAAKQFDLTRTNLEVFQSLSSQLDSSAKLIALTESCLLHNKTARYLTSNECLNNQLSEFPDYRACQP